MRKLFTLLFITTLATAASAQGWPANYGGVMLQGFSWDSYDRTQWTVLESQAQDFKGFIDLIWVPQSGRSLETTQTMGYLPYYYFNQNSSFGTEAELRSMISTMKNNGIGVIADVVINHHQTDGWFGFPAETYNGETYQFLSTDITANDDGGATKTQADAVGISLSSNDDEGEDWSGARDLDHKSANVQTIIKAYEKFLVSDLGYTGFRYDMVKGFDGSHVGDYNDAAGVSYSVGEYWDSNSNIENWIKATGYKSAAFDFQFRYNVRDAINNSDWTKLNSTNNLMHDASFRQYAVTFVENHDMQDRGTTSGYTPDPIKKDTLAANAYLLAMPGTPCIFQPHWLAYKQELKSMIAVRKAVGITNQSTYAEYRSNAKYFSRQVTGQDGTKKLLFVVGSGMTEPASNRWGKVLSGYHYAYYMNPACETAWVDKASGDYSEAFNATLTAVSATTGTKLVYTLDGTTPTASSTQVESGATVNISSDCTLTVGLLINGTVSGVVSRTYTFTKFEPFDITVNVNVDNVGWSTVRFYTWNSQGNHASSKWPGDVVTAKHVVNGKTWYYKKYTMESATDVVNFVFNNGTSQTVDKTGVSKTSYFEVSTTMNGGKYEINDVTSAVVTGITDINAEPQSKAKSGVYTLDGRLVRTGNATADLPRGIYISGGKKVVVR